MAGNKIATSYKQNFSALTYFSGIFKYMQFAHGFFGNLTTRN